MIEPKAKPDKEQVAQKIIDIFEDKSPYYQAATLITMGYLAGKDFSIDGDIIDDFEDMNFFVDKFLQEFLKRLNKNAGSARNHKE